MRRTLATLTLAGLIGLGTTASAHPSYVRSTTVRCKAWAEDSAANLKLVKYEPNGHAVYRCKRRGF